MSSNSVSYRNARRTLPSLAVVALVLAAGCSGSLLEGSYTFESSPATVEDAAITETGFQELETRQFWVNRTRTVNDEEIEVHVSNNAVLYAKSTEIGGESTPYAGFVTITSPKASVLGQSMNPLSRMSNRELVDRAKSYVDDIAGDRFGELNDVREVGSSQTTVLGTETEVSRFRATGETRTGTPVEAVFFVTKVTHGDDIVVLVGAYPEQLGTGDSAVSIDESSAIRTMMGAISHEE